jgi:antitoxin HicB
MAATTKYSFVTHPLSGEDGGGYLVTFPDLPGCMSNGETVEEAIANAIDAEHSWIATAREFGDAIPELGQYNDKWMQIYG